tara:strand:+ start:535 stop:951 length:417 start_codon:yes stop_codon:yes gene_type:complete
MAVSTVTASAALELPRMVHAGVNSVTSKYVHSGTVGDIVLMAKVPNKAEIIAVMGKITTAETAANATVGVQGSAAEFGSLASGTSPVFPTKGTVKYTVSLSDDAVPQHSYVVVSPTSATWTISATIDLTVLYTAPGQN